MREEIKNSIDHPLQLEKLYRENKSTFRKEFNLVYPEISHTAAAQIWNARLNFEPDEISWGSGNDLTFVIIASFIAGFIAKIPTFFNLDEEDFYARNIGFIVFPLLTGFFAWKNKVPLKSLLIAGAIFLVSVVYINLLQYDQRSDSFVLVCIHLPLLLWAVLGFTFVGGTLDNLRKRLDFLRFNGDFIVMTTLIVISGALLTGLTFGLFELIGVRIQKVLGDYIVVWGLAAAPIVGTYLVRTNPQLVNKVSPVIAKVFTPLVLVTLVIYLVAIMYSDKDPYNDRHFLMIFNLLLIGVMAIILFSIAGTSKSIQGKISLFLLLALSIVTIIVNGVALSAIVFRIAEWGMTPNRLAVLGGNLLILTNLVIVAYRLFKTTRNKSEIEKVENSIAWFLPIYTVWTIFIVFIMPLIFGFA